MCCNHTYVGHTHWWSDINDHLTKVKALTVIPGLRLLNFQCFSIRKDSKRTPQFIFRETEGLLINNFNNVLQTKQLKQSKVATIAIKKKTEEWKLYRYSKRKGLMYNAELCAKYIAFKYTDASTVKLNSREVKKIMIILKWFNFKSFRGYTFTCFAKNM